MTQRPTGTRRKQRGAAALFFTVIALLLTLIVVAYTSNATLTELRLASNDEKAKAALANAEAGVSDVIAQLNAKTPLLLNADYTSNANGMFYRTRACGAAVSNPNSFGACPATPTALAGYCAPPAAGDRNFWLVSCGWSDNNSPSDARRRIITMVARTNPTGVPPNSPVTTGGLVSVSGNATVVNYFNNLTYWSAENFGSVSATGKTAIRNPNPAVAPFTATGLDPADPNFSNLSTQQIVNQVVTAVGNGNTLCTNTSLTRPIICTTSSSSTSLGPDVIGNDQSLRRLKQSGNFFENFMGLPPAIYREANAPTGSDNHFDLRTETIGSMATPGIYWIDANPAGTGEVSFNTNTSIGTTGNPAIVVVNGNLNVTGSPLINGLLYVTGNITGSGSPTIRGSVIAEGNIQVTGGLTVIYDPSSLSFSSGAFFNYAPVTGTWRDF